MESLDSYSIEHILLNLPLKDMLQFCMLSNKTIKSICIQSRELKDLIVKEISVNTEEGIDNGYSILPLIALSNDLGFVTFAAKEFFKFIVEYAEGIMTGVGEDDWNDFVEAVEDIYDQAILNTSNDKIKDFLIKEKEDMREELYFKG